MRYHPDEFTGSVLAIEGITDARAFFHGPTGCRKNLVCFSRRYYTRPAYKGDTFGSYLEQTDRIQHSDVGGMDLITGGCGKLERSLGSIPEGDDHIFIVGSPSTIINGDPMTVAVSKMGLEDKVTILDPPMMSEPASSGYDKAMCQILEVATKGKVRRERKDTINILGLTIWTKSWKHVIDEIRSLLSDIGIEVISVNGVASSMKDLADSVDASLNIVMAPEYAYRTSMFYENLGVPSIETGLPLGYDALRKWISDIAEYFGKDPSSVLKRIDAHERDTIDCMDNARPIRSRKGHNYAIEGDISLVIAMVKWMHHYVGMVPQSVRLVPGYLERQYDELKIFLSDIQCEDSLDEDPDDCEFMFSDGVTSAHAEFDGCCKKGVSIAYPQRDVDFRPAPVLGMTGVSYLMEQLVNMH